MSEKRRVVIIGNSAAGLAAVEAFRAVDRCSEIVMIDRERGPAYSRVATPYFIRGSITDEAGLLIRSERYYRELNISTAFGKAVTAIDAKKKELQLESGTRLQFDLLLIATGAFPQRPHINGANPGDIHVLRTVDDARRLKALKPHARHGLFVGAGLVSLQTMDAMCKPGDSHVLVMKSANILSQTLDSAAAEILEKQLVARDIRIVKGQDVIRVRQAGAAIAATLEDGTELTADFVFIGKGVKPTMGWLNGSGIQTDKGILVDSRLETNIEGIFAAGDVAQAPAFHSELRSLAGLWPAALEQGRIAGRNMAGAHESYAGTLKKNVSRIAGIPFGSIGDCMSDRVSETIQFVDHRESIYRKFCFDRSGVLIGAILVNRLEDIGVIHGLVNGRRKAEYLRSRSSCLNYAAMCRASQSIPVNH